MKKELINKIVKLSTLIIGLFNVLMFHSLRCCWSGISKTLGYEDAATLAEAEFILNLPLIVFVVILLAFITNVVLFKIMKKEKNCHQSYLFLLYNNEQLYIAGLWQDVSFSLSKNTNTIKESKKLKDYIFRLHIRRLHIRLLFLTHDDLITCFMSAKNFIK